MLVNCLAWRSKFVMNSILTVKKRSPVCSLILTYLLAFFGRGEDGLFSVWGLLFCFQILTVHPCFISCCNTKEDVVVISEAVTGLQTHAATSAWWWATSVQTTLRSSVCLIHALEFVGMFQARGLICQWALICASLIFINDFVNILHVFIGSTCGTEGNSNACTLQLKFPHVVIEKVTQKYVSFPWASSPKMFWVFWVFLRQFFQVWSKTWWRCVAIKQAVRISWITSLKQP